MLFKKHPTPYLIFGLMLLLASEYASAQALGNWLHSLDCIAVSIQSAMRAFAFVAIIAIGLAIMFLEVRGFFADLMRIMFGVSLALFASTFLNAVWPTQNFNLVC